MGNESSKNNTSPSSPQVQSRNVFTDTEVAELLERQKAYFEKKQQQKENERKQQQATQFPTQYVPGTSSTPHFRPPGVVSPTNYNEETARSSFSPLQSNSPTGQTLYPNLTTVQNQGQSNDSPSTSGFVFVNSGNFEKRNMPVPSAPPASTRDRSRPRYRNANTEKKGSEDEMKCRTCKNMFGLTSIFQCSRGHSSCSDCKRFGRACGICRQPITDMRNITVESLISEMKVKCPNTDDGCHLSIKMADLEFHSKECPFREMPCPLNSTFGCLWKGKLSQIESHFDNTHPVNRQGAVDTEMTVFNLKNNSHNAHLVVLGSFNFIFHLIVSQSQEKVCMAVQLIGTNISASKWTYEVHVYNTRKGQPRRKYQHVDVCQPINMSIHDIMSESKCAVLPLPYASTFVCDNKLTYKFYIKRDAANDKPFGRNNRGRGRGGQRN